MAAGYFGPGSSGFNGSKPPDLSFKVDKDLQITYTPRVALPEMFIPKPPTITSALSNVKDTSGGIMITQNMLLYGGLGIVVLIFLLK